MKLARRRLQLIRQLSNQVNYLFKALFTGADDPAPISDPLGLPYVEVGTLDITDSGTNVRITSEKLWLTGNSTYTGNSARSIQSFTRANGLTFIWERNETGSILTYEGWTERTSLNDRNWYGFRPVFGTANWIERPASSGLPLVNSTLPTNTNWLCLSVLRSAGNFLIIDRGNGPVLEAVATLGTDATLYVAATMHTTVQTLKTDNWHVVQMGAPFNTDYGLATERQAAASAGTTLTHEANATVEGTWVASTGITFELSFRRVDDNNRLLVRASQTGATIKLIKIEAGVETELHSVAQTWTNGTSYRVIVGFDGGSIRTWVVNATSGAARNIVTGQTFNQSATTGKTSQAVTNFISWPRQLSGSALAQVQRVAPFFNFLTEAYVDGTLASDTTRYNPTTRSATTGDQVGYKTLNSALNSAKDDDTIYVRTGTYSELGQTDVCFSIAKNITLQSYNNEVVTLTYPPGSPPLMSAGEYGQIIKARSNITLDGLTIIGTKNEGDSVSQDLDISVLITDTGQGTIKHCTFQNWGHCAVKYGQTAGDMVIEQNLFEAGGFSNRDHHIYISAAFDGTHRTDIRHNSMKGAFGAGVHLYTTPHNCWVYGNVILDSVNYGIVVGGADNVVVNNTVVNCGPRGIYLFNYDLNDLLIANNIVRGHSVFDLVVDGTLGTGNTFRNNLYQTAEAELIGAGDLTSDPLFVTDPPTNWPHAVFQAGSPAIGAGFSVSGVTLLNDDDVTDTPSPDSSSNSTTMGAFWID